MLFPSHHQGVTFTFQEELHLKLSVPVRPDPHMLPIHLSSGSACQQHCHLLPEVVLEVLQVNPQCPVVDVVLSSLNGCSCPLATFPLPLLKPISMKTEFRSDLPPLIKSLACMGNEVWTVQEGDEALPSVVPGSISLSHCLSLSLCSGCTELLLLFCMTLTFTH